MVGAIDRSRVCACALAVLHGCVSEPLESEATCTLAPGDIVFTEVHANPNGSDGSSEYVELYNATETSIDLLGATLVSSRDDGSRGSQHRFGNAIVDAGHYYVVGNAPTSALPSHVDYSYGSSLGALRNSDAELSLWCGSSLIDQVQYAETRDGRALELDGDLDPDATRNDDDTLWCEASLDEPPAFGENYGSPGARNAPCGARSAQESCSDEAGASVVAAAPGNAFITEWMPNPSGLDDELEWVEVEVADSINLAGLRLGASLDALGASPFSSCVPVDAGSRVVFGASPWAAPRVDADLSVSLGNSGPRDLVLAVDDREVDRVSYPEAPEGIAWQVDASGVTCLTPRSAEHEYEAGNFGTPGEENPGCPILPEPGMCLENGVPRPLQTPTPGTVRITEWMASPSRSEDRSGEWVELRIDVAADLNGLTWSDLTGAGKPLESTKCLSVEAGSVVVFARSDDPLENGGIPAVDHRLDVSLNNRDESIAVELDGEVLDVVAYEDATSGVATQRDDFGIRCDASVPYGDGDLGTPGAPNPACP